MNTKIQAKHTPGPWTFEDETLRSVPNIKERMIVSLSPEMGQEANANARLIAAAPELLELLKRINWAFYVDGTVKAMKAVMSETKAAIAKAEGKGE